MIKYIYSCHKLAMMQQCETRASQTNKQTNKYKRHSLVVIHTHIKLQSKLYSMWVHFFYGKKAHSGATVSVWWWYRCLIKLGPCAVLAPQVACQMVRNRGGKPRDSSQTSYTAAFEAIHTHPDNLSELHGTENKGPNQRECEVCEKERETESKKNTHHHTHIYSKMKHVM